MPESLQHNQLVKTLSEIIASQYLSGDRGFILNDSFGTDLNTKRIDINGFIPDIIAIPLNGNYRIVIGEAKSSNDIENTHTLNQFKAFMNYCHNIEKSLFIVGVPWLYHRSVRNMLSLMARKYCFNKAEWIVPENLKVF